jgi:Cof subfamily protein (haloacid dehalogenase superfamily)
MKYKLLALDIDGTILNDRRELTDNTVMAIKKAIDSGVHVTLCTGRPIQGVKWLVEKLGIETPVITYNGAEIVDPVTNEILFKNQLLPEDAVKIAEWGKDRDVTLIIWSQGKLYGYPMNERVEFYKQIALTEPKEATDIKGLAEKGITKIIWFDEIDRINQLKTQLKETDFKSVTYVTSNPKFLEFFNSEVSKRISMERLAEILGVSREETVAIGDGYNDVPMLEGAGLSIAMGNAPDDIKALCKAVTDDNNNDGVAKAIERYILPNC